MKSKCVVLEEKEKINVKEVEVPELKEGLLIKVYACGVCGTDPHVYAGRFKATQYPSVLGHELYGVIIEVSKNCDVECINGEMKVGDVVALVPGKSCGVCPYCKELPEEEQICPHRTTYGLNVPMDKYPVLGGGYSEYAIILNGFKVYKVNKDWKFGYGTLLEPVAVTTKAVEKGLKNAEKTLNRELNIVIQGAGTIGLFIAIQLKNMGYNPYIIDIRKNRIETAKKLGINRAILMENIETTIKSIQSESMGLGADLVYECAGTLEAFNQSKELVRRGGTIIEMGNFADTGETSISPSVICRSEHKYVGSVLATAKYYKLAEEVLDSVKEHYEDIICPIYSLDEAQNAIDNVANIKQGLKTIIKCN